MYYKKDGFPANAEVVLCTVKKILHNSVFVSLDEYKDREGIVHISEIAPGRIRTIREYVKEGKKIVCLVLRVNPERNHIELSLRRITTSTRIKKNDELKAEQKSEKILEQAAQVQKIPFEKLYNDVGIKIIEQFGSLHECFQQLNSDPKLLDALGIEKDTVKKISELVIARFKPPEVKIAKNLNIKCAAANGIDIIKTTVMKAQAAASSKKYNLNFNYLGAPRYRITVVASDYKTAQSIIDEISAMIIKDMKSLGGEADLSK